jgi:hypothetical protein
MHRKVFVLKDFFANGGVYLHKIDVVRKLGAAEFELKGNDFGQAFRAEEVERAGALLQVHGREQTGQAKVVVTVQVTDEDITNALMLYFVTHQLHLCTLAAINQVDLVANRE